MVARPSRDDFEDFVKRYAERAFASAYRLCGSAEDARELVQEGFLRLLRHWDEVDIAEVENYFFRVLRNAAVDRRRGAERRREVSIDDAPTSWEGGWAETVADGAGTALDALEKGERDRAVRRALDALPREQRAALVLTDMEGRSYEAVAAILEVPLGTVRSRLARARLAFRRALTGLGEVTP